MPFLVHISLQKNKKVTEFVRLRLPLFLTILLVKLKCYSWGGQYFWVLRIGRDLGYHLASVLSLTRWKISVGTLSGLAKVTEVHGRVNEIRTLQLLEVKNVSVKSKRGFLHLAFLTCRKNVVPYFTEERPEARREKPFESQTIRVTRHGHGTVYPQTQDSWCSPVSLTQPFPDHSDDTN